MGRGVTVRRRSVHTVIAGMTLLVAACTPSIGPAPTPTAEPVPTERPTIVTVTPELPTATTATTAVEVETVTPEPPAEALASIECTVSARSLRLRAGPATTFDIVRGLSFGQPLIASARNLEGTWAAVRTPDGVEGWVSLEFVTCAQAVDTLPQATPAP